MLTLDATGKRRLLLALAAVGAGEHTREVADHASSSATTWPGGQLFVCYDAADAGSEAQRAAVQRVLASSWSRAANIDFPGRTATGKTRAQWGPCNAAPDAHGDYSAVALHFCGGKSVSAYCRDEDYDPPSPGLPAKRVDAFRGVTSPVGRAPFTGAAPAFTPGFTHVSLISDDSDPLETRFRYEVIHEFGHALGFHHEQNRPGNVELALLEGPRRTSRGKGVQRTQDSLASSIFDDDSIMHYGSADPLNLSPFRTYLSAGDLLGARSIYARRRAAHGFMLVSDRDPGLAVSAGNGAESGVSLELDGACASANPACTWTYERGMLLSDENPTLAIQYRGEDDDLVLASTLCAGTGGVMTCKDDPLSCQWSYRRGEWVSLATGPVHRSMQARGGAAEGARLVATSHCELKNPDCSWTLPNVLLQNHRDSTLAVTPTSAGVDGSSIQLSDACDPSNPDCTWRVSHGLIQSSRHAALALNASGGAKEGGNVTLNATCTLAGGTDNPACTWTWGPDGIFSDQQRQGATLCLRPAVGALNGAHLQLTAQCGPHDGNCVFMGRFAN